MAANLNLSKSNVNRVSPVLAEANTSFFSTSPEPTSGQLTVNNLKFIAGYTYPLDIYNSSGALVFQKTMSAQQETITLIAPAGTYYMNLNTTEGLAVRKIGKVDTTS